MIARRRAFTLLELLFAVGIILLLAAIVIVALRGVRRSANRADTGNALRSMMVAYNNYSTENKQQLLPGACNGLNAPTTVEALGITPKLEQGSYIPSPGDAGSYVWRLAPYIEYDWSLLFTDYRNTELIERLEVERAAGKLGVATAAPGDLGLARIPSFGLNATYVGGNDASGGSDITSRNPWTPAVPGDTLAATRLSEVKNPSVLIVFAPTAAVNQGPFANVGLRDVAFGSDELRPPSVELPNGTVLQQWLVGAGNRIDLTALPGDFSAGGGVPVGRWGDVVPTAHLDGSIGADTLLDLEADLRKWSPFATGF